jgi:Xaa-Pro aminopeptidase
MPRASYAWEDRQKWLQLPFPLEEYQGRIVNLRTEMEKEGFDALLVHGMPARTGHVRYVANFNSFLGNTLVVIPKSGDPALITETVFHGEPMHAMLWTTWIRDVRWTDFPIAPNLDDFMAEVKAVFSERQLQRSRLGIAGARWMPALLMNALQQAFPQAHFSSAAELFRRVTAIKSPLEVEIIRKTNAIAGLGFEAAFAVARPGVDEFEIAAEIHHAMVKADAEEVWTPIAVVAGPKSGFKHCSPSKRAIQDGDMIFVDISPIHQGYIVDVSRTTVFGDSNPEAIRMLDTALLMADEAVKSIKPGLNGRSLVEVTRDVARESGMLEWFYPTAIGHGVGTTKFESPLMVGEDIDVLLEPNMAFALEPMLVREGVGTAVVEDTILVTETGAEILPCFTRKLWK